MSLMTCRLLRSGTSAANAAEDESAKASAIRIVFRNMMDSPSPRPQPGDADALIKIKARARLERENPAVLLRILPGLRPVDLWCGRSRRRLSDGCRRPSDGGRPSDGCSVRL